MSVTTPILRSEVAADADAAADAAADADAEAAADGDAAEAAGEAAGDELPPLHAATKMDRPANRVSPRERIRMVPPLVVRSTRPRRAATQGSRGIDARRLMEPTVACILPSRCHARQALTRGARPQHRARGSSS